MSKEALSTEEIEAPSMEDTIRQTYEEINKRTEEPEAEERPRDEHGRFAPKEEPAEPVEAVEPVETVEPTEPVEAEPVEPVVPPELQKLGLRKDESEAFAKASPEVQQAFIRRSQEMHQGFEQYREKAQFGDAMLQAINPHLQTIQSLGVHPSVAVAKLLDADKALRFGSAQQKTQFLTQLARDYGVDLGQAQEFAANQPQISPDVEALQRQVSQMQQYIQQKEQAQEWQQRETLNSTISAFASNPDHKHFEAVRNEMAGLLQAGLAPDLDKAYEMAIYANPTIRAQVLAEQQANADKTRQAEATRKANDARKAAAVNVTRKGTLPAAKPIGTMDDTIRETAARLGLIQ